MFDKKIRMSFSRMFSFRSVRSIDRIHLSIVVYFSIDITAIDIYCFFSLRLSPLHIAFGSFSDLFVCVVDIIGRDFNTHSKEEDIFKLDLDLILHVLGACVSSIDDHYSVLFCTFFNH